MAPVKVPSQDREPHRSAPTTRFSFLFDGDDMTTVPGDYQIVPQKTASAPALRAADQGVASSLGSVLSDHTCHTHDTQ